MNKSELEQVIITIGKVLEHYDECLEMFEDDVLESLATSLLYEIEDRKKRKVN